MKFRPSIENRLVRLFAAICVCAVVATGGAYAQSADSSSVLSPLGFRPLAHPMPVLGDDGVMHLSYELTVINTAPIPVNLDSIAPVTGERELGDALSDSSLAARLKLHDGRSGATLLPGVSATLFMDATFPRGARTPRRIQHDVVLSFSDSGNSGGTVRQSYRGVNIAVARETPVRVAAPLRGAGWVAVSGCCTQNPHRGALLAINGTAQAPERFAIDFVQLDSTGRLFQGPIDQLSSYAFFGHPVRAAAPGKVVRILDGLPEQTPGALPSNATIQTAGGNFVVVDIGRGRYAFYAHLSPGSIRVKRGQRVRTGQVLGLLGNSGNTDAPHLHFHVMDSPSPLESNGLPFTFREFRGQGVLTDLDALLRGEPAVLDTTRLASLSRGRLPMDNQVVDFGR